ncbi:pyrrolidone-carboxylate peptidase [Niveispirillum fermenti]|uniref:pyroglutamyl-peptidase I family protein n=1 Tax=Niveispirillum fermenti TaxID=1233113 RepID=UPI003A8B4916
MTRLLVTGFAPFLDHAANPTAWLAERLDGARIGGADVTGITLPVTFDGAVPALLDAVAATAPDAVVMFGLAYDTDAIRPERLALNLDDSTAPDNDGQVRRNRPIDPAGPMGYWSSLPLDAIIDDLGAAGIAVRTSRDAGGYICNHLFFGIRHARPHLPAGFIHVPPFPDQVREADRGHRTGMTPERLEGAARLILARVAAQPA